MTERPFRWRLTTTREAVPLLGLAPPTPELYEELCRADVEYIVLAYQAYRGEHFTNAAVELHGAYPETQIRITGTLRGRPAYCELELYRPRFHRMRHGRLTSPNLWGQRIDHSFAEPLGWLWPDHEGEQDRLMRGDLRGMAYSFGAGLRPERVDVIGESGATRARATLHASSGDPVVVEAPIWQDGVRRPTWQIAEDLAAEPWRRSGRSRTPSHPL